MIMTEAEMVAASRVAAGVRYLDLVLPTWRDDLDWELLTEPGAMLMTSSCVFGQASTVVLTRRDEGSADPYFSGWRSAGWYAKLRAMLPGMALNPAQELNVWAAEHGFWADEDAGVEYEMLRLLWLAHRPATAVAAVSE